MKLFYYVHTGKKERNGFSADVFINKFDFSIFGRNWKTRVRKRKVNSEEGTRKRKREKIINKDRKKYTTFTKRTRAKQLLKIGSRD